MVDPSFVGAQHSLKPTSTINCQISGQAALDMLGLQVDKDALRIELTNPIRVQGALRRHVFVIRIVKVESGSPASTYGLKKDDLIVKTNSKTMKGYFTSSRASIQLENRLNHTTKYITLHIGRPSERAEYEVTFKLPQAACRDYQALHSRIDELRNQILNDDFQQKIEQTWVNTIKGTSEKIESQIKKVRDLQNNIPQCGNAFSHSLQNECNELIQKLQELPQSLRALKESIATEKSTFGTSQKARLNQERLDILSQISKERNFVKSHLWSSKIFTEKSQRYKDLNDRWHRYKDERNELNRTHNKIVEDYILQVSSWSNNIRKIEGNIASMDRRINEEVEYQIAEEESRRQHQSLKAILTPHNAQDLSTLKSRLAFYQNPFAYLDQSVFLRGGYLKNISAQEAIISILPGNPADHYIMQMDTQRNLALEGPLVACIVKVIGTTRITQFGIERTIPHVEEIKCLDEHGL